MLTVSRTEVDPFGRFVVGSLLLVPALLTFGLVCWLPALRTVGLSFYAAVPGRPGQFAGLANYLDLARDAALGPAFTCSLLVALVRVLAVLPLPALVGRLWGRQGPRLRFLARALLTLGLALSAPAGLGVLWRLAAPRASWLRWLTLGGGSGGLLSYLLLEFVSFLGLGGALAAMALLLTRRGSGRAARGVLTLAGLAALASGLGAFSLPFITAGGTPTLSLHLFRTAFQRLRLGQAAAAAQPLLLLSLGLGLAFALLSDRLGLRLVAAPPARPRQPARGSLLAGACALALLLLPLVLLYLWGAGQALLFPGQRLSEAASGLQVALALVNGNLSPLLAILLQLPAAYLAAASLTLVRPFGRRGSRLAGALLVASGFVPALVVGLGLFEFVSWAGLLNTLLVGGLPLVAGPASYYLLQLYFSGQAPLLAKATEGGQNGLAAFFQHLFVPSLGVAALAGAVSLLLAGQSLLWPLLVLARRDLYPLSLQLLAQQAVLTGSPATLAAGAWLVLTCWGAGMLLLWWPLQALVLERLRLVAPPQAPLTVSDGKKTASGPA